MQAQRVSAPSSRAASFAPFRTAVSAVRSGRVGRSTAVRVEARSLRAGLGVLGTKAGMMSYFTEDGLCVPATVIALEGGNIVTQVKTEDTDGYNAVQVGYRVVPERKVRKPELGHLAKSGAPPMKTLVEFRVSGG